LPGRGFDQAKSILGADYAGWLIHDGLQLYYKFLKAAHQSCAWSIFSSKNEPELRQDYIGS